MTNPNGNQMVEIKNLNKWFGDLQALNNVDLTVQQGKVLVIIGPSGSGKSTLLRCINFLETPSDGEVRFMGYLMEKNAKDLNKHRAEIGMVFQSFNLYAHLSVLENITLALRVVKKVDKKTAERVAMEQLRRIRCRSRFPVDNSRGQLLRARWRCSPSSCFLMNRPVHLIRK